MSEVCEFWASRGFACLAVDQGGWTGERDADGNVILLQDSMPSQDGRAKILNINRPLDEQWIYHAVGSVILANSLLRSFPDVDGSRVGVVGSSWGGFVACIIAGVDRRFAAVASVYGCGFVHERSIWKDDLKLFDMIGDLGTQRWVALWDPSSYLGRAEMPVLFVTGSNDFAYPIESHARTVALVPRHLRHVSLHSPLKHDDAVAASAQEVVVFMRSVLAGGPRLLAVDPGELVAGRLKVRVAMPEAVRHVRCWYTSDKNVANVNRIWHMRDGRITDGFADFGELPADVYAYFVQVIDHAGAVSSTPFRFADQRAD